jgi:hypothetical protein
MSIVVASPVGKDRRIQHLPTAGAFPGIKGTDKVIKLLSEHAALAAWTLHNNPPNDVIAQMLSMRWVLHHTCQELQQEEIKFSLNINTL